MPSSCHVADYYDSKTNALLERYGPGPRVHYHSGLIKEPAPAGAPIETLRQTLVMGQEQLLIQAAATWKIDAIPFYDVLDVGCGLGGGSIFWAQEFGAKVTAVTIAPSHLYWVKK